MMTLSRHSKANIKKISSFIIPLIALLLLSACGETENKEKSSTAVSSKYNGPDPATADIGVFKVELWDKISGDDKCGKCHNSLASSPQSPFFADRADVNEAYDIVTSNSNPLVNMDDPALSRLVTKVDSGHNCWAAGNSVCVDLMTRYIKKWTGGASGSTTEIDLLSPSIKNPAETVSFPADTVLYSSTIYPLLTQYCSECHIEGIQSPFIASDDIETSYTAVQSKINLDLRFDSRLVTRLRDESHNCWEVGCMESSDVMKAKIEEFVGGLEVTEVDPELVISKALNLSVDGQFANSGGRVEDSIIALYEFKVGEGNIASDTSTELPALDLTLSGNYEWVGGWGIKIGPAYTDTSVTPNVSYANGRAQGSTGNSKKIYDAISGTSTVGGSGAYSIEAWLVPGNVSQEDSHIITYSGSSTDRNFTLGQTLYNYDFSNGNDAALSTADDAERLQASLQHVVITFALGEDRKIYVNGSYTEDLDPVDDGSLAAWDSSFALVLGNETDGNSLWQGTLKMVAIHSRALNAEEITQNYDVGVGEKFFMLFNIDHLIEDEPSATPDDFIVFETSQYDSYSYLFSDPYFVNLDKDDDSTRFDDFNLKGIRLGINGKEAAVGQAFKNVDTLLSYTVDESGDVKQVLSPLGTIISQEKGPDFDEFFLSFEEIGTNQNLPDAPVRPDDPLPIDGDPASKIGLKTFDEINVSMSALTGISKTDSGVDATFTTIKQQLPTVEALGGFLSAHQMAITQLAIQYCDALVEDDDLAEDFFPDFDFDESANTVFDADGKAAIINPLITNFIGTNLNTQPADNDVSTELDALIELLTSCSSDTSCTSERSHTVVKASCAAVLGSAITLVQ